MGLYLQQQDTRSPLQERLAKELQDKARKKAAGKDLPDGVEDSSYVERTRKTSNTGMFLIVAAIVVIIGVVWLVVSFAQ